MGLTPLEEACVAAARAGHDPDGLGGADWTSFALVAALRAAAALRASWSGVIGSAATRKLDGTPATPIEREVEERIRAAVAAYAPDATVVGEEAGGELPDRGWAVAVDPVDGTWAFLNGTEQFSTTLAVFRDGEGVVGVVAAPAIGEVAYAPAGSAARLIRLGLLDEPDQADDLPLAIDPEQVLLVNLHPTRVAPGLVRDLQRAWAGGEIRALRSPGGSPAWGMVEAAKGRYTYANLWMRRPADPFDLTAGALVVRAAGGEVLDLDGMPIDAPRHSGPFVAGIHPRLRERVLGSVRDALEAAGEWPSPA